MMELIWLKNFIVDEWQFCGLFVLCITLIILWTLAMSEENPQKVYLLLHYTKGIGTEVIMVSYKRDTVEARMRHKKMDLILNEMLSNKETNEEKEINEEYFIVEKSME